MPRLIAVFPGQGSQYVGMGLSFLENFSYIRHLFQEAEDCLNLSIRKILKDGSDSDLLPTSRQQPLIYLVSISAFNILKEEKGFDPDFFAGHSLGELSALCAAGYFSFAEGLMACAKRGQIMEAQLAGDGGESVAGGMLATLGGEDQELENFCSLVRSKLTKDIVLSCANFNTVGQTVLSGHLKALEKAQELVRDKAQMQAFPGIKKLIPLKVSVPFHSLLMRSSSREFESYLATQKFQNRLNKPYFSNVSADLQTDPSQVQTLLVEQIYKPVRWKHIMEKYKHYEIDFQIECGPGSVLSGLLKRMNSSTQGYSFEKTEQLKELPLA